jgi:hypothetical protein
MSIDNWFKDIKNNIVQGNEKSVSGAFLVGDDTTNYNDSAVEIFRNPKNHVGAVASIIYYSAGVASFDPYTQTLDEAANGLGEFYRKLGTFPGFTLVGTKDESFDVVDYVDLTEKIKSFYTIDEGKITIATRGGLSATLQHAHTGTKVYSYIYVAITGGDKVGLRLLGFSVSVDHDSREKVFIPSQNLTLRTITYETNGTIVTTADRLAREIPIKQYSELVNMITTPNVCS